MAHAGAAPMISSFAELEETEIAYPVGGDNEAILRWMNNTPAGRLIWGKYIEKELKGEKAFHPAIITEEVKEFLKKLGKGNGIKARKLILGHNGLGQFYYGSEKNLKFREQEIRGFEDFGDFAIQSTTEGAGAEIPRSGDERRGRNSYGVYTMIDLDADFGTVYVGSLGQAAKPFVVGEPEKTKAVKKQSAPVIEKLTLSLTERIDDGIKKLAERKGIAPSHYAAWDSKGREQFEQDLKAGRITEKDARGILTHFETTKTRDVSEKIWNLLGDKGALASMPDTVHKYLLGKK
ncbi:MAG TPA: hypothetical protein VKE88_03575, partial [Candidatus Nanoarchaeia archaeon]|nr:hypothetical protein [Candidatus Nanoarchaeia archaeon]